jgi:hypothetical protein
MLAFSSVLGYCVNIEFNSMYTEFVKNLQRFLEVKINFVREWYKIILHIFVKSVSKILLCCKNQFGYSNELWDLSLQTLDTKKRGDQTFFMTRIEL